VYTLPAVTAEADNKVYTLNILNTSVGDYGEILIKQRGRHSVFLGQSWSESGGLPVDLKGTIDMSANDGTVTLVSWSHVNGTDGVYCQSVKLIPESEKPVVTAITDLVCEFYDTTLCTLKWTSPTTTISSRSADLYDLRYSSKELSTEELASMWVSLG